MNAEAEALPAPRGRIAGAFDAGNLPSPPPGEIHEVSHGAADVEKAARIQIGFEMRHHLRVKGRDGVSQFAVFLDHGQVGPAEVSGELLGEAPGIDINQTTGAASDDPVRAIFFGFREDRRLLNRPAEVAGDAIQNPGSLR